MASVKILVVDHYALLREALKAILGTEKDMSIIGEAVSLEEAAGNGFNKKPDIVIMSLAKPNKYSDGLVRRMREEYPDVKFLVFSVGRPEEVQQALFKHKMSGLLKFTAEPEEIKLAVRAVHRGENYLDPQIAEILFNDGGKYEDPNLSDRQLQILKMIANGFKNKRISSELGISLDTVKTHVRAVYKKLRVSDRAQAVSRAYELCILERPFESAVGEGC